MSTQHHTFSWPHVIPLSAIALGLCVVMLSTGCGTSNPQTARYAHETALAYYNQPNTAEIENIQVKEGGSYKVEITGPASVVRSAPIPTKNIIPQNPSIANTAIEWAGRIGLGWIVGEAFQAATAGPQVVNQPAPLIVRPEVVPVPTPAGP